MARTLRGEGGKDLATKKKNFFFRASKKVIFFLVARPAPLLVAGPLIKIFLRLPLTAENYFNTTKEVLKLLPIARLDLLAIGVANPDPGYLFGSG